MIRPVFGDSSLFVGIPVPNEGISTVLFPNPVRTTLNIRLDEGARRESFSIFSAEGRQVMSGLFKSTLDVSYLDPGVYTIRLYPVSGLGSSIRFVIQD